MTDPDGGDDVKATRSYLICSTPRSGSTLLCEALGATGVAGRPEEYYQHRRKTGLPRRPLEYFEDIESPEIHDILGEYTRVDDEPSLYDPRRFPTYRDYLDWTIAQATTPNGVFGAKVMWGYFNGFVDSLRDVLGNAVLPTRAVLERTFPGLDRWIFMTRRDKPRQAISLWKAIQNWTWKREEGGGPVIRHDLVYSFEAIHHLVRQLEQQERDWLAWFGQAGIEPRTVVYEDFAPRYEETALELLDFLSIPRPADLEFGPRRMTRQADALNEEWLEQYRRDAGERAATLPATG
jgi:LPS sulfotransferase NodH